MKRILILGATSDIGKTFARECALKGYDLILSGRDDSRLKSLSDDLRVRSRIHVETVVFDVLDFKSHISFYENLPFRPDIVACFIGLLGNEEASRNDFQEANKIIDTNYTGIVSILNKISFEFKKQDSGTIITITSVAGDRGRALNYHYGSAKSGLSTYLSGLRNDLYDNNIRVIDIKLGYCRTKMTEHLSLPSIITCDPEQVSRAIFRALKLNQDTVYVVWIWRWIMLIICLIPEFIFKRIKI